MSFTRKIVCFYILFFFFTFSVLSVKIHAMYADSSSKREIKITFRKKTEVKLKALMSFSNVLLKTTFDSEIHLACFHIA